MRDQHRALRPDDAQDMALRGALASFGRSMSYTELRSSTCGLVYINGLSLQPSPDKQKRRPRHFSTVHSFRKSRWPPAPHGRFEYTSDHHGPATHQRILRSDSLASPSRQSVTDYKSARDRDEMTCHSRNSRKYPCHAMKTTTT